MTPESVPAIVATEDGSHTLRHAILGDCYHSMRGAAGEAEHVFIRNGIALVDNPLVRIFEMGFGSGLNALMTLRYAAAHGVKVEYHAVELYPVPLETVRGLNYDGGEEFADMHRCEWGAAVEITSFFSLKKHHVSLLEAEFDTLFDVIYFDAFSPDTQPELWSAEVFSKLYRHTAPGGIFTTYSSKGSVKRALREAGYEVKRVQGALGKRHMITAYK